MSVRNGLIAAALVGLTGVVAHVAAQGAAQTPAPPAGTQQTADPQGGGRAGRGGGAGAPGAQGGAGRGGATFPAQQRPPADAAVVARGKGLYGVNCQSCHGVDLRGGDQGGPNLLRSPLVLDDRNGELILPIVRGSRQQQGMDPINIPDADVTAIATYIHSVAATMQGQGGPPRGNPVPPNEAVLVGNVAAGQAYFAAKCSACHSVTGDLQGIGTRIADARMLQNAWVGGSSGAGGRGGGGRGGRGGGARTTVAVTLPSGEKIEGTPARIDDFLVVVNLADGTQRSIARNGDLPKVEIKDPLEGHKNLLTILTDKDMHDVTAYLASIK
jgi:cytochrome c oxidase cbb3-type subunit 3